MRPLIWSAILLTGALTGLAAQSKVSQTPQNVSPEAEQFFESKIRPLLADNCYSCHGNSNQMGRLRLDSRTALLKGGTDGRVIVPGKPEKSLLIRAIHYDSAIKMPPAGRLKPAEIAALTDWIKIGAPWPDAKPANSSSTTDRYIISPEKRNFWSFRPVRRPSVPKVKLKAWVKSTIDAFILAKLEAKGLKPAPPADRRTLIRRATFDLTGLPPTPAEVDAFVRDRSPNAYAKVVDRLLSSPRYGERWGRHWLDVVRYCDSLDTRGLGSEGDISAAWRYRDWVVDAFNNDMPYDRFVTNQIAGDLLPGPTPGDINVNGIIATGMLAIGNWGNGDADKEKILTDIADDQVDVVSRGFMGLTVACARCHDHKFDPIPTKDYYGLAGIFFSTHILPKLTPKGAGETPLRIPLLTKAEAAKRAQHAAQVADLEKQRTETYRELAQSLLPQTARYVTAAWDYSIRSAEKKQLSLSDWARSKGLYLWALRQWVDYLGLDDTGLFTNTLQNLMGNMGVHVWKGANDLPSLTLNTNNKPLTILTFTLPPRSVCVHPGPNSGVAVGWRSPLTGRVQITGRVADADPACGDGIAWVIQKRGPGGTADLASGDFPNGGMQPFTAGKGAERLVSVPVRAGETIRLVVLPKADYGCDTTVVELEVAEQGGARVWNLTRDLINSPLAGNPHADSYGNAEVWHCFEIADISRTGAAKPDPALKSLQNALAADTASRESIEQAAQTFAAGFTTIDESSPFRVRSTAEEADIPPDVHTKLAKLDAELAELKRSMPGEIPYANGAQEGGVPESSQAGFHDVRVHIRGSYLNLGDLVPRHFPIVLADEHQPPITSGSGRLELARWLASPAHPLTARVIVNRLWQHHFGEGIVRTPSNFGFLGERPTHPELLDWLASQLVASGWSLKQMHRQIMLSNAYQQSSIASAQTLRIDPGNRLFGRMNRIRLESEAIRDSIVAVAGRLDLQMGGPATQDFNSPRRTLYLMTIRSDRSGFGALFDAADSTASADHRVTSTVAPQALFLLNDPFILEQTKVLAQRILFAAPPDDDSRIRFAYLLLYGRPPTSQEAKIGLAFLTQMHQNPSLQTAENRINGPKARTLRLADKQNPDIIRNTDLTAWEAYCQILLCANEFIYVD